MAPLDDFRGFVTPDVPLAPLTWFRLGGPAEFLARPQTTDELLALLRRCHDAGLRTHVLAAGSNVLVPDAGVRGVVIHLESPAFADVTIRENRIEVGAAVPLTALISQAARAGLAGLETLTGIPGTIGGALRGNAGGKQSAIGQFVNRVNVVDDVDEVRTRERDDITFGYRWSDLDEQVILSSEFELVREDPEAVVRRMRRVWIVKRESQPYGHEFAGLIFRNPVPEVTAAQVIEEAGLRGARKGGAEVSERHPEYIVAHPGASSADVLALLEHVREHVRARLGVELEAQIHVW